MQKRKTIAMCDLLQNWNWRSSFRVNSQFRKIYVDYYEENLTVNILISVLHTKE